ncbi:reverse transcriptase [Gossypium australe]|uniref:Reverse transcriptase n=1 Tax=Gossypium australe TaxID=47621 RepID=A0A5B6VMI0_9ROSI|nr:reverse transcriptase [Gossypium australe]
MRKGKLVVRANRELQQELFKYFYESVVGGHFSTHATRHKLARKGTIWVVVDRLTNYGHIVALSHPFFALTVAQAYLDNIYKLHRLPDSIASIKDKIFISLFWKELFNKLGIRLHLLTANHPQTDGQPKALNKCLESYIRCKTEDHPGDRNCWLPLAEW